MKIEPFPNEIISMTNCKNSLEKEKPDVKKEKNKKIIAKILSWIF